MKRSPSVIASGAARERVFIPQIGIKFDRENITGALNSMLADFDGTPLQG